MSWAQIPTFRTNAKGQVWVEPAKDYIQPFELGTDRPNQIITIPPGATVGPFPFTARYDGPIEVFFIKAVVYAVASPFDTPVTDYDIDWLLEHAGKRKQFMNRFAPLIATAGDGGRPYVLPETIFIPAVQSLQVTFRNNDLVNTRKVELVLGSIKFYPNAAPQKIRDDVWGYVERRERTYAYWQVLDSESVSLPAGPGAASVDVPGLMTVPDDTDLEVFKLTSRSTGAYRCQIRDGQTNRGLTSDKIHASLLFGGHIVTALGGGLGGSGGVYPARWATSFLVRRSIQLQLLFDNLTALTNVVKPVLGGRKMAYAT